MGQENKKVFIIAEAGVNHNGSLKIAKKMVDVAIDARADAVKFQTFKAEKVITKNAAKAEYQIRNTGTQETQFDMLKKLELSEPEFIALFRYCTKKKITFMSSPFDIESADFLDNLGMKIFKIPSGEITNKPFIQHIALKKKPIILSTGMSYLKEVKKAIGWINEIWECLSKRPKLKLLHCISDYPAQIDDVNLSAMNTMKQCFGLPVGYSDHTLGIEVPIAAVALGAAVIEKHFTLDRNMMGPDHKASLVPSELKAMVKAIRNLEGAFGDGVKRPARCEIYSKKIARRSIVALRDIEKGERFTQDNIIAKRPEGGISVMEWDRVIGKFAKRDFEKDEFVEL